MSVWVFKCHNVTMFQCHNSQMSQCIPVWAFVWKSCCAMAGFNNNSWTMNASVWGICLKWDIVGMCLKRSWGVFKVALVIELQRWGKVFRGNPISVLISVFNDILSKAPRMFRYSKYINSYYIEYLVWATLLHIGWHFSMRLSSFNWDVFVFLRDRHLALIGVTGICDQGDQLNTSSLFDTSLEDANYAILFILFNTSLED